MCVRRVTWPATDDVADDVLARVSAWRVGFCVTNAHTLSGTRARRRRRRLAQAKRPRDEDVANESDRADFDPNKVGRRRVRSLACAVFSPFFVRATVDVG